MPAQPGSAYTFNPSHGQGYGQNARGMDLTAEMTELDLKPGTVVTVHSLDAESAWPIVGWTDDVGIDRLTSIEPAVFDSDFTPA